MHLTWPGRQRVTTLVGGHQRTAAFVLFALVAVAWLWPLLADLGGTVLGDRPNDASSTVRDYWVAEHSGKTPFTLHRDDYIGAPEGHRTVAAIQIANAVQPAFVWALKDVAGLLTALNMFLVLGFVLTAFVTFLLLKQLELGFLPSLFGGYVFGFSPWVFEQGFAGHVGFVHAWVLPLLVLALLRMRRHRTFVSAAVAGLAIALAFYVQSYLGLLAGSATVVFLLVDLASVRTWKERLWVLALFDVALAAALGALGPAITAGVGQKDDVAGAFSTRISDFYGAEVSGYVLPSARQPLAERFLAEDTWPPPHVGDAVVFFGYSTLGLALAALVLAIRRHPAIAVPPERAFAVLFATVLLPVAFITSLPPHVSIVGLDVPTPSQLIGKVTVAWRIYSRFGLLVGLALVILAACALHVLVTRHGRRGRWAAVGLIALVGFEFAPGATVPTWAADPTPLYVRWLANQPAGIVANYPVRIRLPDRGAETWVEHAKSTAYYQTKHGHPIYATEEGFPERSQAIRLLTQPLNETSTSFLAAEGVKYVLVHDAVYRGMDEAPPTPADSDYRYLTELDGVRVFLLRSKPRTQSVDDLLEASVDLLAKLQGLQATFGISGFYDPEPAGRWLYQDGVIQVSNESTADRFRIELVGLSNRQPRMLELRDGKETILGSAKVPTSPTKIVLGPFHLPRGRSDLVLHTTPGPELFQAADERITSLYFSALSIEAVASAR